jgi:hypothetical protein
MPMPLNFAPVGPIAKGNHLGGGRFKRWEVQTLEELEVHR